MKKLEKERQTAIDEKKSRLADMHQAQLERMEKEKSIQLYRHTKRTKQYSKVKFKTPEIMWIVFLNNLTKYPTKMIVKRS